jgi:hypothetical protein
MNQAAVGFRVHSGWTAMVAVSLEQGKPAVLDRQRPHLVENFIYKLRQPYHTAERMPIADGRAFVASIQAKARELAYQAICTLQSQLHERGYELTHSALLLASGRQLPELEKILASHALIHTADGELFREGIIHASERCGLRVTRIKDAELLEQAAKAFRVTQPRLLQRATQLGRPFGAPWSQDEKFAALAAWLASIPAKKNGRKPAAGASA